ncbi:MAG: M23 family metallopeptidase [Fidelibacterota bacterium]
MKAKRYTVLVIPDNEDKTRQLTVRKSWLTLGLMFIILFVTGIIAVTYIYFPKIVSYDELEQKYNSLAEERIEMYSLLRDLRRMQQLDILIRKTLGPEMELEARDETETPRSVSSDDTLTISFLENFPSQLPLQGYITQHMSRSSLYRRNNHYGIDIAAKAQEPILASASGFVVFAGWTYDMGNMIILYHGDGYFTYYGHNERNLVQANDVIKRGDVIGLVGSTGVSSGPHLHFEIWKDGVPVDPLTFFPQYYETDLSSERHG